MDSFGMNRITLEGDLTLVGVKEQAILMARHIVRIEENLADKKDQSHSLDIDLTGMQSLDACGCQLLAVFMRNLRERGAREISLKLNDDFRAKIHSLGFDDDIFPGEFA